MFMFLALLFGGLGIAAIASGGSSDSSSPSAPVAADVPLPAMDASDPEPAAAIEEVIEEQDDPVTFVVDENVTSGAGSNDNSPLASDLPDLPDSAYDIGWAGLSAEEQLIVELVNRARLDPQAEVTRLDEALASGISSSPVEALAVVPTLSDAAEAHSEDMDNQNYFSHTGRDGDLPWDRAAEAGHENTFVGENIGWIGSTSTSFDTQARAEAHHENLWISDDHQRNLMSDNWSEIGLGYDYGSYQGYNGSTFVTELFGDTGEAYLTGVVIEDEDGDDFYDIGEGQGDVRITAYNDADDAFATATWASGGYSLALPAGSYRVVFEGGDLDQPYETDITIGDDNAKLDVIDEGGASVMTLSAAPADPTTADVMALIFDDTIPGDMPAEVEDNADEESLVLL